MKIFPLFALGSLVLLSACSTVSYYSQSIQGQMHLLLNRENIDELVDKPDTPEKLKFSLQQAQAIRQYASEYLALPDNQSYREYVDLKQPYVVWNVFAAPEFSLSPTNWCYPIVGCVSYRGYFAKEDAEQEAKQLSSKNLDVFVGGIAAYSTLGWFDDPLLNTMLHWKPRSLAGLIFHELSHQIIYIQNETSFNEAFSSSVERLGTIQWLLDFYPDQLPNYLAYLNAQNDFRTLLLDTRKRLMTLYEMPMETVIKRIEKKKIIAEMKISYFSLKKHWPADVHFDAWFNQPINNARLTASMTYLQYIPAFFQIFTQEKGDWHAFYAAVLALEKLSADERKRLIINKSKITTNYPLLIQLIKNRPKKTRIYAHLAYY